MTERARAARHPWRTRNLTVLAVVSLFQDTASELLYPVLPIFLTAVLGAPVAVVAVTEGLADGAASVVRIVSGRLADRRSRRPLVATGYALAAAAKVAIAAATVWPVVLVARVADRFGKGIRGAPRDALIADATLPEYRGRAFGFHRMADTTGAVVGPLLGLALYHLLDERIRPLLVIAAVPAVISVALVFLVREPRPVLPATADDPPDPAPAPPPLPRRYWRVVAALTVFSLVNFSDALLLLRATHLGLGVTAVIGVYCLFNVTYALLSYPAGALSDRVSRRLVYGAGLLVFAVAYTGLGLITSSAWVWVLFPLYGAFAALTDGVSRAWIVDLVPAGARGRAIGFHQGLAGGATVLAGLWAGLAWGSDGRLPLLVAGVTTAALATVLLVAGHRLERADPAPLEPLRRADRPPGNG